MQTLSYGSHKMEGLASCYLNPWALRTRDVEALDVEQVRQQLQAAGVTVPEYQIDRAGYEQFMQRAAWPPDFYGGPERGLYYEKTLEHYVGAALLELNPEDVLVDVAACGSPWYAIAPRLYGCEAYALDLNYPAGVHGHEIGADATATGLPDGFATKISVHCAFEMFENDADIRFLREAARLLRRGGKAVIVPLYMHHRLYYVESNPRLDRRGLDYSGAVRVWRTRHVRFSRKYSPRAFLSRLVAGAAALHPHVWWVANAQQVHPDCYLRFALTLQKLF